MEYIFDGINKMNKNELDIYLAIFSGIITLATAYLAVRTAFRQIARQFEHKVMYEGWKDLQSSMFDFSTALIGFDSMVQGMKYFIESQDNPLVNEGNKPQHRLNKWKAYTDAYSNLQTSYVKLLRAYENHEVIFLELTSMKDAFIAEYRNRVENKYSTIIENIFPEMYGKKSGMPDKLMFKQLQAYWYSMTELSAFLDDFRRELQNVTAGRVVGKEIPKRVPRRGYKILTRNGFVKQK